ncbi:hypothetical protein BN14_07553 [Rhizoctonia solani AG-1 IB]|uniref:Nephrocystin 3-like N-terminal domain-containing protein n=1 Tax=Thanatephorus cucumeris (strain AG1-IB / isolate 7/3/14) TaxID=1108050 RepID=M5C376_THACB|nr:hypothetical protein BN14_07553 [Rhizoctonia solani AG-1 IB]
MPNIAQRSVAVQFKNLILEPLQSSSVKVTLPTDVVVIIDALDECSSGGAQILSLLVENAAQLPIKFIVTSRPDPLIARQMEVLPTSSAHKAFYLHDIGKSLVQEDIKAYLMHEFHKSKFAAASEDIERLAAYAGNLFIVAATTLRFNICNLKTSYYLDEDYPDLNSQMDAYISPELFYACRYWVDHLRGTSASTELSGLLKRFLYEHLLFWIEVINLRDWVSNATNTMSHAFEWLTVGGINHLRDNVLTKRKEA